MCELLVILYACHIFFPYCMLLAVAPLKAVVGERYLDWLQRLTGTLGIQCAEVTGDTDSSDYTALNTAQVFL